MGADFIYAATELPPGDIDTETLCKRIEWLVRNDVPTQNELYEQMYGADDIDDTEIIQRVCNYLRQLREGWYSRNIGYIDTYDKDGNPYVLTISGQMSWGDTDEALDALWALGCLPDKWWLVPTNTAIVDSGWDWLAKFIERDTKED
jgi:hypothetical protein